MNVLLPYANRTLC